LNVRADFDAIDEQTFDVAQHFTTQPSAWRQFYIRHYQAMRAQTTVIVDEVPNALLRRIAPPLSHSRTVALSQVQNLGTPRSQVRVEGSFVTPTRIIVVSNVCPMEFHN